MVSLKRLKHSKAARNAGASYFSFASIAASAFISIPLAVTYLTPHQIGLWTVVNQIVQYLLWMDLGVGAATGRKMAPSIALSDHVEFNRWWTATRVVLTIQGIVVVATGITLMNAALALFHIPASLREDAFLLISGSVVLVGISFPLKGIPGLMAAQERVAWIHLIQGIAPWISLGIFAYFLKHGHGVHSYLWGMATSQLAVWIGFNILVWTSPHRPKWDRKGISGARFKSLFAFSMSLSAISLINAVISSLPAFVISRASVAGGLAVIPMYMFTYRGPNMLSDLSQKTGLAFYPRLQRLYIEGRREEFKVKYQSVGILNVSFGLAGAGATIAGTRSLVELLAGPAYFGGSAMVIWLAIGVITIPLSAHFQNLRQIAGKMGKTVLFSVIKMIIALVMGVPLYQSLGLAGLAAVFMVVPLIDAIYGYFYGSHACGFHAHRLSSQIAFHSIIYMILIVMAGSLTMLFPSCGVSLSLAGKTISLPGWSEMTAGSILASIGLFKMLQQLFILNKPHISAQSIQTT